MTGTLWRKLSDIALSQPHSLAIISDDTHYTWEELARAVTTLNNTLRAYSGQVIALYADNCPEWIMIDLACQLANVTLLPLPKFFSEQQINHALTSSGATALIHAENDQIKSDLSLNNLTELCSGYVLSHIEHHHDVALPKGTNKITFTSGSTGQPKGVCLSLEQQLNVAESLLEASELRNSRHLSVMPYSTLLENIGGIYAPLLSGGTVFCMSNKALGFNGQSGFDLPVLLSCINTYKPSSMILLPELLLALVSAVKQGWLPTDSLEFIAVGGSKVSASVLEQAEESGLPVYQGYGLSECGSVVSVNSPKNRLVDSVGKPLPHTYVEIEQGEIVVSGNAFLGYIDQESTWYQDKVYTGDLGSIDQAGFLHIEGRKKNLIISSYGRNISPEWIEGELLANGMLKQCVVLGDAKPFCSALIYPRSESTSNTEISQWIEVINQGLPDYARVKQWVRLQQPLTFDDELLTSNARPVRENILSHFKTTIDTLYRGYS